MATRKEFCDGMNKLYEDHGMYVGTGNGERTLDVAGKFFEMEKNYGRRDKDGNPLWYTDTARDYEYLAKCYRKKWDMSKSRAGDCSGIIVGVMRDLKIIKPTSDYSAKMFQKEAMPVDIEDLQAGDLVFNKLSDASHVGVYVGDGMVVESQGRDVGVTKRKTSEGGWIVGGRLDWFDDSGDIPPLTRNLYYREGDLMRGEDVRMCQEQLTSAGYGCGSIDGVFGKKTKVAVQAFQLENDLEPDGVVGQKTWAKLWE